MERNPLKKLLLVRLFGLELAAHPSTGPAFAILWLVLALVGYFGFNLSAGEAALVGLICTMLHYLSELWHNLGHAAAARRTGYPMSGVFFWAILATSRYPANEPELPARIHITRALGGPVGSGLLTLLLGLLLPVTTDWPSLPSLVVIFFFIDNLLVFTIGALVPLGFNDGGTLVKWWRKL